MDDLVKRADAIAYIDRIINSGLGRNKSLDYIHKYISALPSAEAVSREECDECKADKEGVLLQQLAELQGDYETMKNAYEDALADAEWIPCSERLPSDDVINRADAIEAVYKIMPIEYRVFATETKQLCDRKEFVDALKALPSADVEQTVVRSRTLMPTKDFTEWAKRIKEENPNAVVIPCDAEVVSAVPQLKQTDTLIIADALRYLAKDTERHLVDRTRADALRQQFLKYGASMCKGGDDE